ncbi:MAG: [FeFe] hydrogenase H-cluster maturation GTPase HydF [Lentisphaerae bacterium]|nr:[FeFe] hydrogenase H-cluster maturation GTPase HydF [Lentisphaerota bacterium]
MGMNDTPLANRLHIGIFGRRNAGKSSLINAITGQDLAIVSAVKGTTTDPVFKTMEILPIGPIVLIDTAGTDDDSELGALRLSKTRQVINKSDLAVLVVDAGEGLNRDDRELLALFQAKDIPAVLVFNKCDLAPAPAETVAGVPGIAVSARSGENIHALKELLATMHKQERAAAPLVADLLRPQDLVLLVIPVDSSAPKGRLILPQQQVMRDILDADAVVMACQPPALPDLIRRYGRDIRLVITDSQAFAEVGAAVPEDIPLTSFSILFARYKGVLPAAIAAVKAIATLADGDRILIAEGCTHHRQCDDIGTVKIPRWLKQFSGKQVVIDTSSGTQFPDDLSPYKVIIHCGACMLNEREVRYRYQCAADQGVPMTNYGLFIAQVNGILQRAIKPLT